MASFTASLLLEPTRCAIPCARSSHGRLPIATRAAFRTIACRATVPDSPELVTPQPDANSLSSIDEPDVFQCSWPRHFDSDYTLGAFLAKGSFGRVYTAKNTHSGQVAAVKVLSKLRQGVEAQRYKEKIEREVAVLEQLQGQSSGVLQLLGVYEDNDNVYLVSELCAGGTLAQLLERYERLSEREAAALLRPLLEVLKTCHAHDLVYSDIKPANVMLRQSYPAAGASLDVCVADFGGCQPLAKGQSASKPTGTPLYMAPELFMCSYDHQSDVWGAGMLLHQMVVGRLPFFEPGVKHSPMELAITIMTGDLDMDAPQLAAASPELRDLLPQLLDKDPSTRLTPEAALQHPWFAKVAAEDEWALPAWSRRSFDVVLPGTYDEEDPPVAV